MNEFQEEIIAKLVVLNYPNANDFQIENEQNFRQMVVWMEENIICNYENQPQESMRLKNIADSSWSKAFDAYLDDLKCTSFVDRSVKEDTGDWLVGHACRLQFRKNKDKYLEQSAPPFKMALENPLDGINVKSKEFKEGVRKLAKRLNIVPHYDDKVTLEAIEKVIARICSPEEQRKAHENQMNKENRLSLKDIDLGFDVPSKGVSDGMKIAKLLYLQELRKLQTEINEIIVEAQSLTSNPKTDTRLGKVGR